MRSALLASVLFASACTGGTIDEDTGVFFQPDSGTRIDAGAADSGTTGLKGENCTRNSDCIENEALCRTGNVCTGALDDRPFEQECASGGFELCPGLSCIGLRPNQQGKTGICSLRCNDNSDCGSNNVCVDVGRKQCLRPCTTNTDCVNGFVCVDNPMGAGRACLVEVI